MIPLASKLESRKAQYTQARDLLQREGFSLGGGWDYTGGAFDKPLDEAHTVWLRLPFEVISGKLDADTDENDASIRFGKPFVLHHRYTEGLDGEATMNVFGGLVNQFQEPADPDAPVDRRWLDRAESELRRAESRLTF